jgi:hypothetical protein
MWDLVERQITNEKAGRTAGNSATNGIDDQLLFFFANPARALVASSTVCGYTETKQGMNCSLRHTSQALELLRHRHQLEAFF